MPATAPSVAIEFMVPGLGCLLSRALATAARNCAPMRENEQMCGHVCDRLYLLRQQLADSFAEQQPEGWEALRRRFGDVVASFVKFLGKRPEKSLIKRLASSRKVEQSIRSFHDDVDRLQDAVVAGSSVRDWRARWEGDRRAKVEEFEALVNSNEVLTAEKGSTSFVEGLFMLKFELEHKATEYATDEVAELHLQLMRRTLVKLLRMSNVKLPAVPDWFIPSDDVEFDEDMSFDCGSYGSVHRGTWSKGAPGGKGAKVVIKCLLVDDDAAKESFYKEVDVWRQLDHPHVLKLYGACHVSSPAFFVCDDATQGSFGDFFERDRSQLWRLFYEASLGLAYLHAKKVVHGDLKCTNLLVGSDLKAKLCDFGFSYVRAQSVGLSAKSQTEAIRWKAPECLLPPEEDLKPQFNPRFASDVYSLGMSIIEAIQGDAPYGILDDDEIMDMLFEEKPYPRPEGMTDEQWLLVQSLIQPDWQQRISLSDAIEKLKAFADEEATLRSGAPDTHECSVCKASMPLDFAFCGRCGTTMAVEPSQSEAAAQHKNKCPRCEESVLDSDHFCRHCGLGLDADPAFAG
jgi:hypothetical protein